MAGSDFCDRHLGQVGDELKAIGITAPNMPVAEANASPLRIANILMIHLASRFLLEEYLKTNCPLCAMEQFDWAKGLAFNVNTHLTALAKPKNNRGS